MNLLAPATAETSGVTNTTTETYSQAFEKRNFGLVVCEGCEVTLSVKECAPGEAPSVVLVTSAPLDSVQSYDDRQFAFLGKETKTAHLEIPKAFLSRLIITGPSYSLRGEAESPGEIQCGIGEIDLQIVDRLHVQPHPKLGRLVTDETVFIDRAQIPIDLFPKGCTAKDTYIGTLDVTLGSGDLKIGFHKGLVASGPTEPSQPQQLGNYPLSPGAEFFAKVQREVAAAAERLRTGRQHTPRNFPLNGSIVPAALLIKKHWNELKVAPQAQPPEGLSEAIELLISNEAKILGCGVVMSDQFCRTMASFLGSIASKNNDPLETIMARARDGGMELGRWVAPNQTAKFLAAMLLRNPNDLGWSDLKKAAFLSTQVEVIVDVLKGRTR
jgi:hypothetical protein